MNNAQLHMKLKTLVGEENTILVEILKHLREVERRKMYCDFKRGSLFEYAVKDLGYSEDAACRRIQAMRLIKELPEAQAKVAEEKISEGLLSLTNLGNAQTLFSQEAKTGTPMTPQQKIEVLENLEGKSAREGALIVRTHCSSPQPVKREKIRQVASDQHEMTIVIDTETLELLNRLYGLMAHKTTSKAVVLKEALRIALEEKKPKVKRATAPATSRVETITRYIPIAIRAANYERADGKCENCGSTYALQHEHHVPFAKGGAHRLENMKLLCRACNQHRAIQEFGLVKMSAYRF